MPFPTRRIRASSLLPLLLGAWIPLAGCEPASPPPDKAPEADGATGWRYHREYVFVGEREGSPVAAPFAFRAAPRSGGIEREVRAWLARGEAWDHFLDEEWLASEVGGVWKVLPHGALSVASRGPLELEALWYRQGERRLRLAVGDPLSPWMGGQRTRTRILEGRLALGQETLRGMVVEEYDVTPGRVGRGPGRGRDQLVLAGGDTLRLLLTRSRSTEADPRGYAWVQRPGEARVWEEVEMEWLQAQPLEEARRDVPTRWRFRVPGAGLSGEVRALGSQPEIGLERGGRKEAEIRYTVEGWVEREGRRIEVRGMARHEQG